MVGSVVSAIVFVWCAKTSWRLITGRPRLDGGLLSPWVIAGAGVLASTGILYGLSQFGGQWIGGALYLGSIAIGCFELARRRLKNRERRRPSAA